MKKKHYRIDLCQRSANVFECIIANMIYILRLLVRVKLRSQRKATPNLRMDFSQAILALSAMTIVRYSTNLLNGLKLGYCSTDPSAL